LSHLSAYLQEPCYWAAQQCQRKFPVAHYGLGDYFQMAIAEIQSILTSFNPDRGSLLGYAQLNFSSRLRDKLRQQKATDGVTTWTLLRSRVSKTDLLDALHQAGLSPADVAQYHLAWTCFKQLYSPTQTSSKRLPEPDRALWEAVAQLYNRERTSQLTPPGAACNPDMLEQWMKKAAAYVRAYLYPPMNSLDAPNADGSDSIDPPDPQTGSLLNALIATEEVQARLDQQQQLFDCLIAAVQQLPADMQTILSLYYQQGQTQQQIMGQLGISQPTVARRLVKARDALLNALVIWSRDEMNNPPTPDLIKDSATVLEEWLQLRYAELSANPPGLMEDPDL
jgi:RNA polymerase sigma factor (sigma-70 family)